MSLHEILVICLSELLIKFIHFPWAWNGAFNQLAGCKFWRIYNHPCAHFPDLLQLSVKEWRLLWQLFYRKSMKLQVTSINNAAMTNMLTGIDLHCLSWTLLCSLFVIVIINTMRPRQNGGHFPDNIFKWAFLNENVWISVKISLKFVPKGPFHNIPALIQIMAMCWPGDRPLSEPMMVSLLMYICFTGP